MPHLVIEYSSNIIEKKSMPEILAKCHKILVDSLPTEPSNCKGRAMEYDQFVIGSGDTKNAFIHINLKILPGRARKVIKKTKHNLIRMLEPHFATSFKELALQMTIEVSKLKTYSKIEAKK